MSLLKQFDIPAKKQPEVQELVQSTQAPLNMYFDPLAKRKIRLEANDGDADMAIRRGKIQDMFDPLDNFLMKKGGLRLDKTFIKSVEDLAMHVFSLCNRDPSRLEAVHGEQSKGHKRLSTKYTFLSVVHLLLKARSLQSDGSFIYEISLNHLLSCYTHLHICQSTLGKYLCLVRAICKEEGRELGSTDDKQKLFFMLSEKMGKIILSKSRTLGLTQQPEKLQKKLLSNIRKFTVLHTDLLKHYIGSRPIAHHAFSVAFLCITTMLPSHSNPKISEILNTVRQAEPHFGSLDYSACIGCVMSWKIKSILKFRAICLAQEHRDPFLWSWRNFYKQNKTFAESSVPNLRDPEKQIVSVDDETSEYINDTTTANSLYHVPASVLGKRKLSSTATIEPENPCLIQLPPNSDQIPSSNFMPIRLLEEEKEYMSVIIKYLLKSSTLSQSTALINIDIN